MRSIAFRRLVEPWELTPLAGPAPLKGLIRLSELIPLLGLVPVQGLILLWELSLQEITPMLVLNPSAGLILQTKWIPPVVLAAPEGSIAQLRGLIQLASEWQRDLR